MSERMDYDPVCNLIWLWFSGPAVFDMLLGAVGYPHERHGMASRRALAMVREREEIQPSFSNIQS